MTNYQEQHILSVLKKLNQILTLLIDSISKKTLDQKENAKIIHKMFNDLLNIDFDSFLGIMQNIPELAVLHEYLFKVKQESLKILPNIQ